MKSVSAGLYTAPPERTHDSGDLRNYARCNSVFKEDFAVTSQSVSLSGYEHRRNRSGQQAEDPFSGTGVVLFYDFSSMHFAEPPSTGEILCEYINQTAIDGAVTSSYTFARKFFLLLAEVCATMFYETIQFNKGSFVEECSNSFTLSFCRLRVVLQRVFAACSQNYFGLLSIFSIFVVDKSYTSIIIRRTFFIHPYKLRM